MTKEQQTHDILEHYGILGMRWGKRKSKISKSDIETKTIKSKKKISEMTDTELDAYVKRMRLETEASKLTNYKRQESITKIEDIAKISKASLTITDSADKIIKTLKGAKVVADVK